MDGWMDGWMDVCMYEGMYVYMYICRYVCISMYMQARCLVSKRGGVRFNLSNFFGQGNLGAPKA